MICDPCYRTCRAECKNVRCECRECGGLWFREHLVELELYGYCSCTAHSDPIIGGAA